jgi:hypothetical protein
LGRRAHSDDDGDPVADVAGRPAEANMALCSPLRGRVVRGHEIACRIARFHGNHWMVP